MTNTESLTATTNRDMVFHAGRHDKHIPAGTEVEINPDLIHDGVVRARVVGRNRVSRLVLLSALDPS